MTIASGDRPFAGSARTGVGILPIAASASRLMALPRLFRFTHARSVMNSRLLPEEKLAVLQSADPRRKWHSLDDRRVCVLCERTITGRQVEVIRDASGAFTLRCPTEGCQSLPSDWFYHGNGCSAAKSAGHRDSELTLWAT